MTKHILPVLAIAGVLAGAASTAPAVSATDSHDMAVQRNLKVFNNMVEALEHSYVDSIRVDEAFKAAVEGMLNTVDPYTEYFAPEDRERLEKMTSGSFSGIGAYLTSFGGNTYISEPIEGAPAQKAGLHPGDKIVRVDTTDVVGKSVDQVTKLLKGQAGTDVKVRAIRPYQTDSVVDVTITRAKVKEKSVPFYGEVGDGVGYVRLTQFIDESPKEVEEALRSFKNNPEVKSVVLDLRGNGGGVVEAAVDIVGFFVPRGTEVITAKGKTRSDVKIYKTTRSPLMPDIPLIVMIDGGSASASEIVAGSLQDLDRALLVGSNSFGKGLVQSTVMLPFDALLKVTVAKYYIPSGRLIQALDYSRRNPDGSVARTPDSLTNVFHTRNGREVRDGGGLKPDTLVDWGKNSTLLYDLVTKNQIFKYANKFQAEHPTILPPDRFTVTDEIFDDFTASVDTTQVKPDRAGLLYLSEIRDIVKEEGYSGEDGMTAMLDSLETLLSPSLERDMKAKRREITHYLSPELAARYYGEGGRIRNTLTFDPAMVVVKEILADPAKMRRMLGKK